jgi:hypothetical protein
LQVGDSVRQRLEHIETALQDCSDRMASESSGAPDPVVAATCTILADLLTSAGRKLGTELGSILFSLQKLGTSAEAMTRAAGRIAALKGNDSADAVTELRKMFGDGIAMLYSSQNHRRSVDRRIRVLFQSVQDMNEKITQMRWIDQKMRMVSINVSLRSSATQGREGPLFVVASQFMDLTAEAFAHQKDLVDALEQVRQAADGLDYDPDSELDNKVGEFTSRLSSSPKNLAEIDEMSDWLNNGVNRLLGLGPEAVRCLTRSATRLDDQRAASIGLRTLATHLAP